MKKVLLVLLGIVFLTGCTNVKNSSIADIIEDGIASKIKLSNQYRTGYKYYLPKGLSLSEEDDYNEKIKSDIYTYYLYVDIVSKYYGVDNEYEEDKDAYYWLDISEDENNGYVQINSYKNKYLVEIMYNYAKIEVIVKEEDINLAVASAITILSSIQYNDNVIENVMNDNTLEFKETELNIFDTKETDGNYINYEEMYGQYEEDDTHDSDLID